MTFRVASVRKIEATDPWGLPVTLKAVEYEAEFWEAPIRAGETGRRVKRLCKDTWFAPRDGKPGRFLNTAPSVSYYGKLLKAV